MKLSLRTFWALLWCWTQQIPVLQTQKLCHVKEGAVYHWFRQFRLHLPDFEPILQGKIQMDEAYFKSLSLVMAKQVGSKKLAHQIIFKNSVDKSVRRNGCMPRVIDFIDQKSELAKNISNEYWVKEETEKEKFTASLIIQKVREAGFKNFGMYQHIQFWKKHDGKNPSKGFGVLVVKTWYWYKNWVDYILGEL